MSGDIGNDKEHKNGIQDGDDIEKSSWINGIKKNSLIYNWPLTTKILELIFNILSLGLVIHPMNKARLPNNNWEHAAVIYVAYAGCTMVSCAMLGGRYIFRSGHVSWGTAALIAAAGSVLNISAGIILLVNWNIYNSNPYYKPKKEYLDMFCAAGFFGIFNSIIFGIDAVLTLYKRRDFS